MKKKFLSLMMAAAVVATTSVSAFAANVVGPDNKEAQTDVTITGNVQDTNGNDAVGTFKVTVPTNTGFTVTKNGTVIGAELNVENAGTQNIEVYAYKFVDKTGNEDGGISVVSESEVTTNPTNVKNNKVSLKLTSSTGEGEAFLSSGISDNGVHTDAQLNAAANGSGVKLLSLQGGTEQNPSTGKIKLDGKAGQSPVDKPVSDEFKLTLKIKKATNS